ncbi:ABC transporter ATP-binding protein [Streptomyces yokosukanensis]|uniref:ABC transporter ATP-binding protein n=1 Tax=Streptomyces yokosukanensis TaxID=67386 RepID=UPI003437F06F
MGDRQAAERTAVLSVSGLEHRVSETFRLGPIGFSVPAGQGVAIIGTNGAGKSTLIRLVAGLLRPARGEVLVCGTDSRRWGKVSRHIGYVQQAKELPDGVGVETYLRHQLKLRRAEASRLDELMALADLDEYRDQYVRTLSGGNQRKLHIISAVAHRPDLLILDEPTTGLDPAAQQALIDLLRGLKKEGVVVLFASHQRAELDALADSVVVLHQGRQVKDASLEDITRSGDRSSLVLEAFAEPDLDRLRSWAARLATTYEPIRSAHDTEGGVQVELAGDDHRGVLGEIVTRAHDQGVVLRSVSYSRPTLADIVRSVAGQDERGKVS